MFSVFGLVKIEILNKDGMSHSCEIIKYYYYYYYYY